MGISVFDLFKRGIGPSSSHTVGPMRAAYIFIDELKKRELINQTSRLHLELFGSLAYTGEGHGTKKAVLMGIEGHQPESIDPDQIPARLTAITESKTLNLGQWKTISFDPEKALVFNTKRRLPQHSNGMTFQAFDKENKLLYENNYYSIGGGFIIDEATAKHIADNDADTLNTVPHYFENAVELENHCRQKNLSISALMMEREMHWRSRDEINNKLLKLAATMEDCIEKGCNKGGVLPGGLNVRRRAYNLHKKLTAKGKPDNHLSTRSLDWLNLFAIAVNEENAAGGRVVTAPTNGAAGVIPAVLQYYKTFYADATDATIIDFLLTAAAIGILYKKGASISGAEVGCQGEIGVASSMAAGAFAATLHGNLPQILNAAEIAMEHHLGMTCDPVAGLVQIPCIERNAMGAIKAVNAARLALLGDGKHKVSLDAVIATMLQTGKDMKTIYKETSLGGLAANVPEC